MIAKYIGSIIRIPIQIWRCMYKIIRLPDVVKSTGLARSTIYKKISLGEFPKSISLGTTSVGWLESDVQQWIESRIQANPS